MTERKTIAELVGALDADIREYDQYGGSDIMMRSLAAAVSELLRREQERETKARRKKGKRTMIAEQAARIVQLENAQRQALSELVDSTEGCHLQAAIQTLREAKDRKDEP